MGAAGVGLVVGWSAMRYATAGTPRGWAAVVAAMTAGLFGVSIGGAPIAGLVFLGAAVTGGALHILVRRELGSCQGV